MSENKFSPPLGFFIGMGLTFGAVLYVFTQEGVWIGVGIAIGAARELRHKP
ncbi:MAG: hypothetical protein P8Q28_03780 [Luminiphilus sp.]|nr:hypothetical protein [Luminiphilus sp.]